MNKSVAGGVLGIGFKNKILNVGVKRIGRTATYRHGRVLVDAEKVTHIDLKSEVVSLCCVYKGDDPFAVLTEKSVIFGAGANTLFFGVIGNLLNGLYETGNKVLVAFISVGGFKGYIVTHKGSSESLGNVDLFLKSHNFLVEVSVTATEQVCPYRIARNCDSYPLGLGLNFLGIFYLGLSLGNREVGKLNTVEAVFFGLCDYGKLGITSCFYKLLKAV